MPELGTDVGRAFGLPSGQSDDTIGTYVLALWRAVSTWNRQTKQPINVAPHDLKVLLPDAHLVEAVRPLTSDAAASVQISNRRVTVSLAGDPVLLKIDIE